MIVHKSRSFLPSVRYTSGSRYPGSRRSLINERIKQLIQQERQPLPRRLKWYRYRFECYVWAEPSATEPKCLEPGSYRNDGGADGAGLAAATTQERADRNVLLAK